MNKAKFLTVTGLMATSVVAVGAVAMNGKLSFVRASGTPKTIDLVPAIVASNELSAEPNTSTKAFDVTVNGTSYRIETLLCSINEGKVVIERYGYIRNISAINGLETVSASTPVSFVECAYDDGKNTVSSVASSNNAKSYLISQSGTNFVIKTNGAQTTLTSLTATYTCSNTDSGLKETEDALFTNEWAYASQGSGTEDDPYLLDNELAFVMFAKDVNSGNSFDGEYFKLINNLDFSKENVPTFIPVGNNDNGFEGHFAGASGETTITLDSTLSTGGIFGYAYDTAVIENLTVDGNIYYTPGSGNIGGIVGYIVGGTIRNCTVNCNFLPYDEDNYDYGVSGMGGVAGCDEAGTKIYDCTVNSELICQCGYGIGGIAGFHDADNGSLLKCCTFNGSISTDPDASSAIGGLVGELYGDYPTASIQNCVLTENAVSSIFIEANEDQSLGNDDSNCMGYLVGLANTSEDYYIEEGPKYYFDPNIWDFDGAWYAAYTWDKDGSYWFIFEKDYLSNYYKCDFDLSIYDGVIFVRLVTETLEASWDNKWNQTVNCYYSEGNNLFTITNWGGDNPNACTGSWSNYIPE